MSIFPFLCLIVHTLRSAVVFESEQLIRRSSLLSLGLCLFEALCFTVLHTLHSAVMFELVFVRIFEKVIWEHWLEQLPGALLLQNLVLRSRMFWSRPSLLAIFFKFSVPFFLMLNADHGFTIIVLNPLINFNWWKVFVH